MFDHTVVVFVLDLLVWALRFSLTVAVAGVVIFLLLVGISRVLRFLSR
jgi:hypothetical protein